MVTTVQDGIAIAVHGNPAHPHTDGALCTKVSRYPERTLPPAARAAPAQAQRAQGFGPV
jgi:anaerobic selenocysteine-containing dehydrogenase